MVDKDAIIKVCKTVGSSIGGFVDAHLRLPTYFVQYASEVKLNKDIPSIYLITGYLPVAGTLFFGVYPGLAYHALFHHDKKIATAILATQITTNVLSGLYELYKHEKNKNSQKQSVSSSSENLETEVEKPETQIPDPWEVKLPTVESLVAGGGR